MKNITIFVANFIRKLIFSKISQLTVMIHWVCFLLAIFQRSNITSPIHPIYEPWLFNILLILDMPGLILAGLVGNTLSAIIDFDGIEYFFWFLFISFEWLVIGYIFERIYVKVKDRNQKDVL
jgi:hypothetical protein